jgi:hypothetical protein
MIEKQIKRHSLNTTTLIRVGDKLECIPGFINHWDGDYPGIMYYHTGGREEPNYGGSGYEPGKIFISNIEFILSYDDEVFFPSDSPYGIFHKALRKI